MQLAWSVTGATKLVIDNAIGDVTGKTSTNATISADTTFTLTASNEGDPAGVSKQVAERSERIYGHSQPFAVKGRSLIALAAAMPPNDP